MDGFEWVVHTSVLQAVTGANLDAWGLLNEILHHHVLALDEGEEIRERYKTWLSGNPDPWVTAWYQRISQSGKFKYYLPAPLAQDIGVALSSFGLLASEHIFVTTARQTLDRLLAGDETPFSDGVCDYLNDSLRVRAFTDWEEAIHHRQQPTAERVRRWIKLDEGQHIEFKKSLSQLEKAIQALVAFANATGGHVLFGVNPDRSLAGVQIGSKSLDDLSNEITRKIESVNPPAGILIEQVDLDGKTIIVASIEPVRGAPCRVRGHVYRRIGSVNKRTEE
ncbi:MAG: ATP-binding protein [Chloroflexi bacterium]|nr:ATP-binding protein [Chloroflexota bacterium]